MARGDGKRFAGKKLGRGSGGVTGKGFTPGKSGNPGGQYAGMPTAKLRLITEGFFIDANQPCPFDKPDPNMTPAQKAAWKPRTYVEFFRHTTWYNASRGNTAAINQIFNRLEGKVPLTVQGPGGMPIGGLKLDLSKLSNKDLDALEKILEKAAPESVEP